MLFRSITGLIRIGPTIHDMNSDNLAHRISTSTSHILFVTVVRKLVDQSKQSFIRIYCRNFKGYSACCMDVVGNQPIQRRCRTWRVNYILSLNVLSQCITTQTSEPCCFQPLILHQHYNALTRVMLRPGQFTCTGEYPGCNTSPEALVRSSLYSDIDY
jgi:hypothetical protein